MRQQLTEQLNALLDKTACLGAGLADANGMLIQAQGEHDGFSPELIASLLSPTHLDDLGELTGERFAERLVIGERYAFFSRWSSKENYMLYAIAPKAAKSVKIRIFLKEAVEKLEELFAESLVSPARERLEQPREFADRSLIR